jgi:hypothetical protein
MADTKLGPRHLRLDYAYMFLANELLPCDGTATRNGRFDG